jgi:hypothetical protein
MGPGAEAGTTWIGLRSCKTVIALMMMLHPPPSYPPPGLAFGEPDDRLRRVSSTPQVLDSIAGVAEYLMPACAGMTGGYVSAFSQHHLPEFCKFIRPKKKGRREDRVRAAPAVSRANAHSKKRTRAYRFSGSSPAFPAQWFYGLFRALLGETWLVCHRRP